MTELDFIPSPLNSRFQLSPLPSANPGHCAVCGCVDRPVVDFGMTIQFFGAVLICVVCMTEAAKVIQMVPISELHAAEESLTQSFDVQLAEKKMVAIPNDRYDAIAVAVGGLLDLVLPIGLGSNALVADPDESPELDLFNFADESEQKFNGVAEQKYDVAIGEGCVILPSSPSDGRIFDL